MLFGQHSCVIDEKGRVSFPSKMRDKMNGDFVVTRWLDGCLVALPESEMERLEAILKEKGMADARQLRRFFYSSAAEAQPDKQGRILIPQVLRQHAGLNKDVTIIGAGAYAEIWDTETWHRLEGSFDDAAIAETMGELGI